MSKSKDKTGEPIPIQTGERARKQSTSAQDIRRRRARRLALRLAIWCGLPTTIAIIYYGFLASPEYSSRSVVAIQSSKGGGLVGLDSFAAAFMPATNTARDSLQIVEYIHSRDMLAKLDADQQILAHYSSTSVDWWSRLDPDAGSEDQFEYYRSKIGVSYSARSGTLRLSVRAYSADKALEISKAILKQAEVMVNKLSERAREDRMRVARQAVAETETRLVAARKTLIALQNKHTMIDPKTSAAVVISLTTGLETQLAEARAKLSSLRAVMQPTAPKVRQQRNVVNSLAGQLAAQKRRLLGGDKTSVKRSIASFEPAMLEKELAQGSYQAALKTLQLARFEAAKQHRYLVTISKPSLPNAPTHPRRLWSMMTVFVVSLLLMGVGTLLWASVREHANF